MINNKQSTVISLFCKFVVPLFGVGVGAFFFGGGAQLCYDKTVRKRPKRYNLASAALLID